MNILNLILAIFLPPVGAFLQVGLTKHFIINIILCCLGWLPGIVHAVWLVATDQKG
ncbi:MAG: YqaE/Pmp3 family membrane protein [Gammaproteobacteria bacterium]|nr:YqaE/Pmp3 family membrane protein [Gammaproteobacteria bacterium]